ncbi:hypothetical protein A2U01_0075124, partial [Trifolium medium]|nr:hypothetical protein [Trifolium medium]
MVSDTHSMNYAPHLSILRVIAAKIAITDKTALNIS